MNPTKIDHSTDRLAYYGGPPVFPEGPPPWPVADEAIRHAVEKAFADGSWGQTQGPNGDKFIAALARFHDVEFVALCCSGTFAVEWALRGLKVGEGDEVILAAYDYPGNFRAIVATGARPVLVDIDRANWGISLAELDAGVGTRTRAIVASHLHGGLIDMRRLMEFAASRRLAVVEDAAQAVGAKIDGRQAGSWGDVGVLSFSGGKLLSAGRGGAILTRRADVFQRARRFAESAHNAYGLGELQAAVLIPQLAKLDGQNARRRANVARLLLRSGTLAALVPGENSVAGAAPSFGTLGWRYDAAAMNDCPVDRFAAAVRAEGVALETGYLGFTRRSERRCRKVGTLGAARHASAATVLLDHPVLVESAATIDRVARALNKAVRGLRS